MRKLIILSLLGLLLTGCRMVSVTLPDGGRVTVFSFGIDSKIGSFEGSNNQGIKVKFNDYESNTNAELASKLADKIPSVPLPIP